MNVSVNVKPNSKSQGVEKTGEREFRIFVKAAPKEGKANAAVLKSLSGYFGLPASRFTIIKGHKTRNKIISISGC